MSISRARVSTYLKSISIELSSLYTSSQVEFDSSDFRLYNSAARECSRKATRIYVLPAIFLTLEQQCKFTFVQMHVTYCSRVNTHS